MFFICILIFSTHIFRRLKKEASVYSKLFLHLSSCKFPLFLISANISKMNAEVYNIRSSCNIDHLISEKLTLYFSLASIVPLRYRIELWKLRYCAPFHNLKRASQDSVAGKDRKKKANKIKDPRLSIIIIIAQGQIYKVAFFGENCFSKTNNLWTGK